MRRFRAFPEYGSFRYTATIDGSDYLLKFRWSDRTGSWYLDFLEPDGTEIFVGNRLVVDWPVFLTHKDSRKPEGILLLLDIEGDGYDIEEQEQLGDSHKLVFLRSDEIDVPPPSPPLSIVPVP